MQLNVQCKRCANLHNDWCDKKHDSPDPEMVRDCLYYSTASNADRIRAMTDEELATTIFTGVACIEKQFKTESELLEWLKQEATNEG